MPTLELRRRALRSVKPWLPERTPVTAQRFLRPQRLQRCWSTLSSPSAKRGESHVTHHARAGLRRAHWSEVRLLIGHAHSNGCKRRSACRGGQLANAGWAPCAFSGPATHLV